MSVHTSADIVIANFVRRCVRESVISGFKASLYRSLNCSLTDGDRPGALIAGTWAAMQYMGQELVLSYFSAHR